MKHPTPISKPINLLHRGLIMRTSFGVRTLIILIVCVLSGVNAFAHPGSGIVVDRDGNVFFTDTGKGIWKIDKRGKLTYMPAQKFHWLAIDEFGYFAESPKNFGEWFERVTPLSSKPTLMMCSDFPLVFNKDGNMYYADTRPGSTRIVRRTPNGKETVIVTGKMFQNINGIASGWDGYFYVTEAGNTNASTIRKITMDGKISIIASYVGKVSGNNLPLETVPSYCRGLAVDSLGIVYVAATGSRSVLKITPQGKVTTILEEPSPWTPTGIAVFRGEVYVLEWHDVAEADLEKRIAWIPRVRKIRLDGKVTTLATVSR